MNGSLRIPGFDLFRPDHSCNSERRDVFYKLLKMKISHLNSKLVLKSVDLRLSVGDLVKQLIILIHFLIFIILI